VSSRMNYLAPVLWAAEPPSESPKSEGRIGPSGPSPLPLYAAPRRNMPPQSRNPPVTPHLSFVLRS